jgi:flagellar hook-associated protein 3 FlgL
MAEVRGRRAAADVTSQSRSSDGVRGDETRLNGAQSQVGRDTTEVKDEIARVGSAFSGAEDMQSQNSANGLTMKQNLSGIENDLMTEVVVRLIAQQVVYQAALAATTRAMTPSLADFLR